MLITIIVVFVAILLPVVVFVLARRRSSLNLLPSELTSQLHPVDIEAFCNLIDPDEEHFLRTNLPPALFRSIQRERLLAATEYVAAVSHNAAVLTRLGEAARFHAEAGVAHAAQQLANRAVRLRLHCLLVRVNLWTAIAWPGAGLSSGSFVERYEQINGLTRTLLRLRAPANSSHASVSAGG
jgi:hypothetical protein